MSRATSRESDVDAADIVFGVDVAIGGTSGDEELYLIKDGREIKTDATAEQLRAIRSLTE